MEFNDNINDANESLPTKNSILTWARELVAGNDALLASLPQYTNIKRRLEKYTKLRGYDIHRFRTQV